MLTAADQRSLVNVAADWSWQPVNGVGAAVAPVGTVTLDVVNSSGTTVVTAGATTGTATGPRTYTQSAPTQTDLLCGIWKDGGVERARTYMEIVGGFSASIVDIRNSGSTLLDASRYDDAAVARARAEVEDALSSLTACDFSPRYHLERLDGSGMNELAVSFGPVRTVRSVTVYYPGDTVGTAWTASQLAAIPASQGRVIVCRDLTSRFWRGVQNVVIGYEAGYNSMPADLRDQFYIEIRKQLNDSSSASQIATQYNYEDGSPAPDPVLMAQQRRFFSTLNRYSLKFPGLA